MVAIISGVAREQSILAGNYLLEWSNGCYLLVLINQPKTLFLDEPTSGLDQQLQNQFMSC